MTDTSFPFEGQDTSETQYSKLFRELQDSGVVGAYGGTSLAPSVGSGSLVSAIAPGDAIVRGHMFMADAPQSFSHDAVVSGSQRIDMIVLRLDPSADSIKPAVVKGTSTTPPTPVQSDTGIFELPIATATVLSSGSLSVVDLRTYVGSRTGIWSTNTRPANPLTPKLGYNMTTKAWEYWNGANWQLLIESNDTGWINLGLRPGFSGTAKIQRVGSDVNLWLNVNYKTILPADEWLIMFTLPDLTFAPPTVARLSIPGFNSTAANGALIQAQPGTLNVVTARCGYSNAGFYHCGHAWRVN